MFDSFSIKRTKRVSFSWRESLRQNPQSRVDYTKTRRGPPEENVAVRITCINKANGQHENAYVAIQYLGWVNEESGASGKWSREQMYDFVVNQNGVAYVSAGGAKADLIGMISPHGNRYVKTRADSTDRDNLLKLSECV